LAEVIAVITLFLGAIIACWFSFTLNDIRKNLRTLVERADKQIDFLDYISDQVDLAVPKNGNQKKK
jgi:hypothetical protein